MWECSLPVSIINQEYRKEYRATIAGVTQTPFSRSRMDKNVPRMEPRELEPLSLPREQSLLLENLRSNQNDAFEDLARRALAQPNVDVDFVYPHPLNKTLLEVACCEGRVEFVELLLKLGANVNRLNDVHNRALIHFAAEAGHADVLRVLLQEKRCNPDLEIGKQTALHIAVRGDSTDCVRALLENCANPNIANSKGLTPIHIAGTNGNREVVELILKISKFPPNIDDFRDFRKRTTRQILQQKFPDLELPTAGESKIEMDEVRRSCFEGKNESDFLENLRRIDDDRLTDVEELIKIAAKRNFPEAVCELLKKGGRGDFLLNVAEASNIAVELGHHKVLREILRFDSKLGNKLLLPACKELGVPCSPGKDHTDDRINCVRLILEQPDINVRCEDDKGNTPLHYAARAESIEAVGWLLRLGSYIGHRNVLGVPPLAHMSPGALSDFFDDCIRSENDRTDEYEIEFDYRSLMPHTSSSRRCDEAHEEFQTSKIDGNLSVSSEMEALAYIAGNRALKPLLQHPLLSSFLYLKWHRIRHVLYVNFVFYVIFYTLINSYILSTNHEIDSSSSPPKSSNFEQLHGLGALAAIFLILLAVRESFQLISSPRHYLYSFENMLELALIVLGAWALVAPNPQVGAIVILLSAWELVILIGQHPRMSTGIEMFKTVTINFIRFLFLYAFLILAFALAFFTLFYNAKDNENFPDPGHSLFKTIIMLTGEFDANDIPFVSHPVLSRCIFILFVFLIAIVLFNLLNGLAVSDTADILNRSELVALISRAKLVSYAERVAVGSGLIKCTGGCLAARTVRRSMFNPLGFLAMRILLFPGYLPQGKLGVQPYKSNKIRVYGRTRKTRSCTNWSMDPLIVGRAREVLLRRGVITENERIIAELGTVKDKLERLETVIEGMRSALENNNIQSNGQD